MVTKKPVKAVKKPVKTAKKPTKKPVKVAKKPVKTAKKPVKKAVKKPVKVAKKPAKKVSKKPVNKQNKDVTVKPVVDSTGVVTITPALGYSWNGHTLGFTEADATVFIRQNNSIRSTIDALSRKTQTSSTQNHESAKAVINAPSANEERLRRELEDALARLNALTEKNESAAGDNDSELEDLLAEGHRLEIKGIHLIAKNKSLEERKLAIKAKIESVKNQSFS